MRTLRWIMVVPGAIAAWFAVFIIGLYVHPLTEKALCPPAEMVSGACGNDKVQAQLEILVCIFVALAAVAVIAAAVALAPSHKRVVGWAMFVAGAVTACFFAVAAEAWVEGLAALTAGVVTIATLQWVLGVRGRIQEENGSPPN